MATTKKQAASAIDEMRKICAALPNTTEGAHFGKSAFKVGGKMFATCGNEGAHTVVVLTLAPDHMKELLATGAPYSRYARAPAISIQIDASTDWKEVGRLVVESHSLCAPKGKKR
jgi:predicted DNA-binding protein (MmcQ/YjbR family)